MYDKYFAMSIFLLFLFSFSNVMNETYMESLSYIIEVLVYENLNKKFH